MFHPCKYMSVVDVPNLQCDDVCKNELNRPLILANHESKFNSPPPAPPPKLSPPV